MKVYLTKDVEKVGMAGEIVKVSDGYGANFIIPRKLGIEVTPGNEASFVAKQKVVAHRKDVIETKTTMLAEKINGIKITLRRKTHDDGKLYGAIKPNEIIDLLAEKGISVSKDQIDLDKAKIKEKGTFPVTIKLSSKLRPTITLSIVAE